MSIITRSTLVINLSKVPGIPSKVGNCSTNSRISVGLRFMLTEVLSKVLTFPAVNPPVFAGLTPPAELEPFPESMFDRDSGRLGSCSLISGRLTLLLRPSLDLVLLTRLFLDICSSVEY
ncbi:hypothetical protein ACLKA7_001755 [Drosophila subpalustris]